MEREQVEWRDFDGDPNSPLLERSFQREGMEFVDPKHVVMWNEVTGEPLVAMNPENGRISWDPRFIDTEAMKSMMRKAIKDTERDDRRQSKGFGY